MIQTGNLPISGKITFDFREDALQLVAKGLSEKLAIKARISFPDQPTITDKLINIVVTKVCPAGTIRVSSRSLFSENFLTNFLTSSTKNAFGRSKDYLQNEILIKMAWLMIGYLDGAKKIPIMILYIPVLGMGAYSLKKDDESTAEFNAHLN